MPKLFFVIIIIILIAGCSSFSGSHRDKELLFNKPRVHLYLYSSFKLEPEKYILAFTSKGYEVELRSGELPMPEEKSFIIHSPNMLNPNHYSGVENIIDIIKSLGVTDINQYQYFLGKHSYTPTNVGIYLL